MGVGEGAERSAGGWGQSARDTRASVCGWEGNCKPWGWGSLSADVALKWLWQGARVVARALCGVPRSQSHTAYPCRTRACASTHVPPSLTFPACPHFGPLPRAPVQHARRGGRRVARAPGGAGLLPQRGAGAGGGGQDGQPAGGGVGGRWVGADTGTCAQRVHKVGLRGTHGCTDVRTWPGHSECFPVC